MLDHVAIYLELDEKAHSITAYAIVSTTAKTGVEMEALALPILVLIGAQIENLLTIKFIPTRIIALLTAILVLFVAT